MVDEPVQRLVEACREHDGTEPNDALRDATGRFLRRVADDENLLGQAGDALSTLPPAARMPEQREALGRSEALLDRLERLGASSHSAEWVRTALLKASGSLVTLHPPSEKGLLLRYSNVANCFHLFTLIQTAVGERIPGGQKPHAALAELARGAGDQPLGDQAWWHYGNPRSATPDLAYSIWGEEVVSSIPVIDGVRVIVLWPPILASRSWDAVS